MLANKEKNRLLSLIFLFLLLLFPVQLFSIDLAYDQFQNNSASGYSRDDGGNNQLKVKGKKESHKTYSFGSSYANSNLNITFKMKHKGGWEDSGKYKDYFKVYFNGTEVVDDTFSGNASSWKTYSLSTQADGSGKLTVKFYANTTSKSEYILIDDVKITALADQVNIKKTVDNSAPHVNDTVWFSIKTTNIGSNKKIEMRDWVESGINGTTPDAFKIISYSTDKPNVTCSMDSGGGNPFLYCVTDVDYANNESFTTTVQAKILKSGNICNRAYGYKNPWDTSVMSSSTVCLNASPTLTTDLSINSIIDTPDPVGTGEDITYTVAISNSGSVATGIVLNATITDGTLKTAPTGWSCSGTSNVTCTRNSDLSDGDSENVIFVFTAPATTQTVTLNTSINSNQNDSNLVNNSASTTTTIIAIIENADDLCYENVVSSGMMCFNMGMCSGGIGCRNTYTLKNIGDSSLGGVTAIYDEDGLGGSFGSSCGVNPTGSCQTAHNVDMGPIGLFGTVTEFKLNNSIPVNDNSNSIWTENFLSGSCFDGANLYAAYIKNGVLHRGKIKSCSTVPPPDETIPTDDANATNAICGTFEDMFQTHGTCNGVVGGTISFDNAGSTLDSSKNIILNNIDNTLNTCKVNTQTWVEEQYETCGLEGDCNQTGTNGQKLNINYDNLPQTATVSISPSSSTNDVTLSGTTTLQNAQFDDITTSWHTGTTTSFSITSSLKINTLKMTNDNSFSFGGTSIYSLDIGTIGIENNGADNTITTDDNAKNIKINNLILKSGTVLTLKAAQTIKMDTLSVGYGSDIVLKAPYVNINNFILDGSGSGDATVTIIADYIDIGDLNIHNHSSGASITIKPYTSGKRVLFRTNTVEEGSNSTLVFYSGNYYINDAITLPGTSDVSAMRAYNADQLINLYVNSDLNPGNNPGINSNGNNGNFGTNPATNFLMFINGNFTTGGGGTTINATIYTEGNATLGNPTYIKGALSANTFIDVGQGQFTYDQDIANGGWGICSSSYCSDNNLSEGFHLIDPDGGDNKNSFEIFCHQDTSSLWHELIALPIKNDSNNFVFDNNTTTSNYYDISANPRTPFHAIEVDINNITYSGTLDSGAPKPHIPVVVSSGALPYGIVTNGNSYNVMGSTFSNINLIGTPFTIDWSNTGALKGCDESLLRKALGQAVKYNTINTNNGTSNDGKSICEITTMKLSLLDDYRYLSYNGSEVLQHSCKEMATYVPNNLGILNDQDIAGHFNILTSEPSYPNNTIPTTNGTRDNSKDIGTSASRPITVYCKYQTDLNYVWTFLTALDAKVTTSKNDLVNKQDTCSQLGLYFYVPNNKDTFNRVRKYLKNSKTGANGWEDYTGTIEEKIKSLHAGNTYYLSAFRDVVIWPYGPMGVYFPLNGNHKADGSYADWGDGANTPKGYMSGSPMHNIKTMSNYSSSMGKKGFVSILGSQDLNKTDNWWIADIGAGEEIGNTTPQYSPHGTHPVQSVGYVYYEPNGNYTGKAWLNFLFDSEGWVYHTDDWNNNYPYYDYMCMSETNYEEANRYQLVPGFFNAIQRSKNIAPNFSDNNISTQIVNENISLDIILYDINSSNGEIDTATLSDQNKSVGVFLSKVEGNSTTPSLVRFLGTFSDFSSNNGRIQIPNFTIPSAIKDTLIQFFYCNTASATWTDCWNYNGNANSPTLSFIGNGDHSDSYDDFAIRPMQFVIDTNSTSLFAGVPFHIDINATDFTGNNTTNYNEKDGVSFNFDKNDSNSTCQPGTFSGVPSPLIFSDGSISFDTNYSDVGDINLSIKEINGSEFALIDADDTNDSQRLIKEFSKKITVKPYQFAIVDYNFIRNPNSNWRYMSDVNDSNITISFRIQAQNAEGNVTKKFTKGCYSDDVNFSIELNSTSSDGNISYFQSVNDTPVYEHNRSLNDFNLSATVNDLNFTDGNSSKIIYALNIYREANNTKNPLDINLSDINTSYPNTKNLGLTPDNNGSRFYYGRVHAPDYRGISPITATIYYEVYSDQNKVTRNSFDVNGSESIDSINWYVNTLHSNLSFGAVNQNGTNSFNSIGSTLANPTQSNSITNGTETITLSLPSGVNAPYKDKIQMYASPWLIYNLTDSTATTNDFVVEFFNANSAWAGKGIQGKTIDLNISTIQNRRLDW